MSAVANVAINVDSRGAPAKLKQVADRSKQVEKAVQGMNGDLRRSQREFKGAGNSASKTSNNFGNLAKGALKLAAAYATLNAAQSAVSAGIQRIESERRIQFLAKQYGEIDQLARAAANASDRFGQSQTTANRAIADIYARLRPVGVSLENIVSVYNGFNTAARISGSTAVEAENAFRQLSQALGSGALRGDEFNSIAEQVPGILTAISQETGVAQGKLRKYAAEGKITADVVIAALQRIEKDGADQLKEALGGPEQAIRDFQNASEDVQVALTTAIVPEMARAFRDLAAIIVGLEPAIRFIGNLIADTLGRFRTLVESIRGGPVVERLRQGGQLGFNVGQEKEQLRSFFGKERFAELEQQAREMGNATMTPFAEALGERLRVAIKVADRAKEIEARQATTIPKRPPPPTLPPATVDSSMTSPTRNGRVGPSPEDILARQTELGAQLLQQKEREFALAVEQDPLMKELLRISYERVDAEERVKDAAAGQRDELLQTIQQVEQAKAGLAVGKSLAESLIGTTEQLDRVRSGFAEGIKIDEQLQKANQQADVFKQTMQGAGDIIGNQLRGAIDGLIDGTADWNSILQDTLKQLGGFLIKFGLNALAGSDGIGILSFLGFGTRANGGPVNANEPYIVGERGPELFIPFQRGQVVSNEDSEDIMEAAFQRSGGSSNVSNSFKQMQMVNLPFTRTAEQASVIAAEREAAQALRDPGPIDVRYESTVINNTEYVTAEQHRKGMAQAAERGRALTLQALQNSPKTRTKVGI